LPLAKIPLFHPALKEVLLYAVDWATKKKFHILDMHRDKLKEIDSGVESMLKFIGGLKPKSKLFLEEGGGDSLKLVAFKEGHQVFTIPGIRTKEYREELGLEKSDETDAVIIGRLARQKPDFFYEFRKLDQLTAGIAVLFKERSETEKTMVRAKNQLFALEQRLRFMDLDQYGEKAVSRKEAVIEALEKSFNLQTKILGKQIEQHPLWIGYLKDVKGVGPIVAVGLVAGIKRAGRFPNNYSLRHYAGMIPRKNGYAFNHQLKRTLYFFADGIVKNRTPVWRELYDNMKEYYRKKHTDWRKGKVDAFARKFVETRFLDEVYEKMKRLESSDVGKMP